MLWVQQDIAQALREILAQILTPHLNAPLTCLLR